MLNRYHKSKSCPNGATGRKEEIKMMTDEMFKELSAELNGCSLMENREKMAWDDVAGSDITINDFHRMNDAKGDYFCITVDEYPTKYFFTGKQLTTVIDKYGVAVKDVIFTVGKKTRTKDGKTFTPFTVRRK